jgi:probable phosphoglycerate mutase
VLRLYLLRHGETEFSRDDRFCGHIDAPLTDGGHEMAACFAKAYGEIPWRAILTSTRTRAFETALPVATRAALPIERDARLDEISYGRWQGLSKEEIAERDGDRYALWCQEPTIGPPDGESPFAVAARAAAVVAELRARYVDGSVLVVSHKTVLRVLLCGLLGVDLRRYRDRFSCPVGGVSLIELSADGATARLLDDVGHLPVALVPPAQTASAEGELAVAL